MRTKTRMERGLEILMRHTRGEASGSLGRASVIDGVVLDVVGQALAGLDALHELGVGNVAGDDEGARQREAGGDGELGEGGADLVHGLNDKDEGEKDEEDEAEDEGGQGEKEDEEEIKGMTLLRSI